MSSVSKAKAYVYNQKSEGVLFSFILLTWVIFFGHFLFMTYDILHIFRFGIQ